MRELKFRYIYQHEEDTIFPERSLEIADVNNSIWTLEQIAEWEPDNYVDICLSSAWKVIDINQYTGLKDINWKEIYEGDIVKWFYNYSVEINKAVVWFRIGRFEIDTFRCIPLYEFLLWHETKLEIIGNIYENPDLITNKFNK